MFIDFKNCNCLEKELDSLDVYVFRITDNAIRLRIRHLLDWYIRKASFYKFLFYLLSMVLIVINALIPILNQSALENKDLIVSIGSSIATIISSALTLFTMKDTWFRYRNHAELIKEECMKYNSCYGDYYNNQNQSLLSENVELIIRSERNMWRNNRFNESGSNNNIDDNE